MFVSSESCGQEEKEPMIPSPSQPFMRGSIALPALCHSKDISSWRRLQ